MSVYSKGQLFESIEKNIIDHISFSGLKTWKQCPYRYMLDYIYGIDKFAGNIHTCYGSAVHGVMEKVYGNILKHGPELTERSILWRFDGDLYANLSEAKDVPNDAEIELFRTAGHNTIFNIRPSMDRLLPSGWDVYSVEEELLEEIPNTNIKFKGYVDLVLSLPNDEYFIIDWKTTKSGWNKYKRSDYYGTLMQLALYKHFWAKRHNIPNKKVKTAFSLIKMVKNPEKQVELFKTFNGPKSIDKGLVAIDSMIGSINREFYPKLYEYSACKYCQYKETQYCS